MNLVSMKTKRDSSDDDMVTATDSPEYPYGLRLTLSDDSLKALGLDLPNVGDKMMIHAKVEVVSSSQHKNADMEHRSAEIQITDMAIVDESNKMGRAASKLYGG